MYEKASKHTAVSTNKIIIHGALYFLLARYIRFLIPFKIVIHGLYEILSIRGDSMLVSFKGAVRKAFKSKSFGTIGLC